jgi:hypothetical protein
MTNLKVGKPDVAPDAPSHTPGIKMGNSKGNYEREPGMLPDGRRTARASTGINPDQRSPIDPRMPTLPPA